MCLSPPPPPPPIPQPGRWFPLEEGGPTAVLCPPPPPWVSDRSTGPGHPRFYRFLPSCSRRRGEVVHGALGAIL